jgi:tetratricopeptide (TPR) repeat protein
MRRFIILFLLLLCCSSPIAFAQHEGHEPKTGWVPTEILLRPVTLRDGIGTLNDPVTTQSKEAQAFYNQGMAYLHSYVWIEAARSFNQALRLDPNLAMAYVGLSRAYLNLDDESSAKSAVIHAQEIQVKASERERLRIAIMAKQLEAIAKGGHDVHQEYKDLVDSALGKFPEDAEMWLIRGNAEESSIRGRGQRGTAASIAFYEAALNRAPGHFAAHHYLIHTYEFIGHVDQALEHGLAYADAASNVPHAQHMYGHDLRRAGRTEEAIARFRKADDLENAYYKSENIAREFDWHHAHNLNLLATAYQYQGQMKQTESVLRDSISIVVIGEYQEFFHKDYPEFLLNRGRFEDALAESRKMAAGKFALARAAGHALAGNALLGLNRTKEAAEEFKLADKELGKNSEDNSSARPYVDALHGELLMRDGKQREGAAILQDVAKRIRAIPGPDAWMQAIYRLELIARIGRETGDWDLAEFAANQMLDHDKYYGGTQFALALVAEHKGEQSAAREYFAKARQYWSKADPDLRELAEINKRGVDSRAGGTK